MGAWGTQQGHPAVNIPGTVTKDDRGGGGKEMKNAKEKDEEDSNWVKVTESVLNKHMMHMQIATSKYNTKIPKAISTFQPARECTSDCNVGLQTPTRPLASQKLSFAILASDPQTSEHLEDPCTECGCQVHNRSIEG